MNRKTTSMPTNDDWHPNFPNNSVRVSCLTDMEFENGIWHRVCVWGADDDGMEIDFFGKENKIFAEQMYKQVIGLSFVNKDILKEWGFKTA